jgi:CRISPR-associated protein Cas5
VNFDIQPLDQPSEMPANEKMPESTLDLSFFLEPPELDTHAILSIEALAPLSMSTAQPGTYYRSQPAPTEAMLYGLLENALGWHFPEDVRSDLLKQLRSDAKSELGRGHPLKKTPWITGKEDRESGSGFVSLLQHHLDFETAMLPETTHFDDLWTRHAHRKDDFEGGSRSNDYRVEALYNRIKDDDTKAGFVTKKSDADVSDPQQLLEALPEDVQVRQNELKPFFPFYYSSPTKREYVVPAGPYRYRVATTQTLSRQIADAIDDPAAPLYLGSNDGWVRADWEEIRQ